MKYLNKIKLAAISLLISLVASAAVQADVLFEGYAKVSVGGIHAGYYISRYEFDPKAKQFISIYYLKTNELGGNVTESLKAYANEKMAPVSYQYTSLVGNQTKVIDAIFTKGRIKATVTQGNKKQVIDKALPKGVFLSSFLAYVMLQGPEGIKNGIKYEYQAIAEEDASIYKGMAYVKEQEKLGDILAYKILNDFKEIKFISYATEKGEVLSTKSPVQSVSTELVANPEEATHGFVVSEKALGLLFGKAPVGKKNSLSERARVPGKEGGIPQGKGIMLKGGPAPTKSEN